MNLQQERPAAAEVDFSQGDDTHTRPKPSKLLACGDVRPMPNTCTLSYVCQCVAATASSGGQCWLARNFNVSCLLLCCFTVFVPQVRPLEMFFPFDPYLLRRSARFLDLPSSYNTWLGAHQQGTDASHFSSDDELEVPEGGMQKLQHHSHPNCSIHLHQRAAVVLRLCAPWDICTQM